MISDLSIVERFIHRLSGNSSDNMGHLTFTTVKINPEQSLMEVKVIDPEFDTDNPWVKPVLGSKNPLPIQSLNLYTILAKEASLELKHAYYFRGDQILNFHDCGRFSIIYLLKEIMGVDALTLSNFEIYKGFKTLQESGYEILHQTPSDVRPVPSTPSRFSRCITVLGRSTIDYILKYL